MTLDTGKPMNESSCLTVQNQDNLKPHETPGSFVEWLVQLMATNQSKKQWAMKKAKMK